LNNIGFENPWRFHFSEGMLFVELHLSPVFLFLIVSDVAVALPGWRTYVKNFSASVTSF
jgi:hypothetical protein